MIAASVDVRATLQRVPLFHSLDGESLESLATTMDYRTVQAGDVVFAENDPGDALFVILSGHLRVVADAASGLPLLAHLGPGEFFGEMGLLTGEPRTAAVIAESAAVLAVLERPAFNALSRSQPALREALEETMQRRRNPDGSRAFLNEATTLMALSPAITRVSIGRSPLNDIVIDEPSVAAHHAELRFEAGRLRLFDLNGQAGTYLNRRPIIEADVTDGDEIWIGSAKLYVQNGVLKRFHATDGIRVEAVGVGQTIGNRRILRDVNLAIYPGELVAIVGPSGAGKTTLLHTLLGLTAPATGAVYYDSYPLDENLDSYRRILGYVPQDDIVHPDLTVEQSLHYAGKLRLPRDTTDEELARRIDSVLAQLNLEKERTSIVRNLSGGQRKRASIGIELLSEPRICFLDEPTSGLDPGLDEQMMALLRGLANEGRTILLTTHATRNIEVCDRLIIVAGGLVVFAGSPAEALEHFHVNDVVEIYAILAARKPEQLAAEFKSSEAYGRNVTARVIAAEESRTEGERKRPAAARRKLKTVVAERASQYSQLTQRDLRVVLSDRVNMALRILGPIVLGGSLLVTFPSEIFAIKEVDGGNAYAAITLLYLVSALSLFLGSFTAANAITRESAIYRRERMADLSPVAYVLAKITVLTGFAVIQGGLLALVLFVGLSLPGPQPRVVLELAGALSVTAMAGMGMGLLVSALSPNPDRAATLVVLLLIPQLIFAGSTVPRSEMREPAKLVSDSTMTKWSLELLGENMGLDERLRVQSFKQVPGSFEGPITVEVPNRPFQFAFRGEPLRRWAVLLGFFLVFTGATLGVQSRKGRMTRKRPPAGAGTT